jgi:ketosteroid isomerase-like protein
VVDTKTEVRTLLDGRVDACREKDIDRLMSLYSPDVVYFDVVPPLQFVGSAEVRRNFTRWFDEYDGPIGLETHDLSVAAGEDVAFAHMLHLDSGTRRNGVDGAVWVRSTVCCRRSNGTWLITHEHISMPGTWPVQQG